MAEIASNKEPVIPVIESEDSRKYFKSLVPEAKKQLLRIMKNSRNEKVVANVATNIIDRAMNKNLLGNNGPIISISADKMVLVNNTLKELLGGE